MVGSVEEVPEDFQQPQQQQLVIIEKAENVLGVRSKLMIHFIIVKFMDLDLLYALQLCKNLLNTYNAIQPVENRTSMQTLLVANTIRVKILMIELL